MLITELPLSIDKDKTTMRYITDEEALINRKRIRLRRRIFEFREKYLALAKKNRFNDDHIKTAEVDIRKRFLNIEMQKNDHVKKRYIYYVISDSDWIQNLLDDHRKLTRAIKNFRGVLTQEFWLPPILWDVKYTYVRKYKAYSVKSGIKYKELSDTHKKQFASLSRKKIEFRAKRRTGMQYKLIIMSNTSKRKIISFPDWAICVCSTKSKPPMNGRDSKNAPIRRPRLKISIIE